MSPSSCYKMLIGVEGPFGPSRCSSYIKPISVDEFFGMDLHSEPIEMKLTGSHFQVIWKQFGSSFNYKDQELLYIS